MADGHLFNNISLGGRGGTKQGQMRVHSGGVLWKKLGGGKAVEVDKSNIAGLFWMKVQRSNQLGVRSKEGLYYKFIGFRDQDNFKHIYIWNGLQCHHFKQKIGLELSGEDDTEHRPDRTQMSSHSPGSVLAPMSGLVVKVLGKNGEKVEAGQPVVVMEAMKMEHVVKSPSKFQRFHSRTSSGSWAASIRW